MALFRNIVFVAALAGFIAGLAMTALQAVSTVPLILAAETYEAAGEVPATHESAEEEEGWAPANGLERLAFTSLANVVSAIGFGLVLVAAGELAGGIRSWHQGILWGLSGFAVFTLAPGLGLPPELPAMPAGDLHMRQMWWLLTVLATAAGLVLILLRRSPVLAALGIGIIIAPHILGAPQPESFESPIPKALHHDFVVAVVVTSFIFWGLLGGLAGHFRQRLGGPYVRRQMGTSKNPF
jgi:cobalt transporter subunit CbtA